MIGFAPIPTSTTSVHFPCYTYRWTNACTLIRRRYVCYWMRSLLTLEGAHSISLHHGVSTRGADQDLPGLVVLYPHHSAKYWRSANTRSKREGRCGANRRGERSTW